VVEIFGLDPRVLEAPASGQRREAGAVLDAVEPLLLRGRDELAVDDQGGRRVTVVRVESENRGHMPMVGRRSLSGRGEGNAELT